MDLRLAALGFGLGFGLTPKPSSLQALKPPSLQAPNAYFPSTSATRNPMNARRAPGSAAPRALVRVVILGNLAWTTESFLTLGQSQATALGTAFVSAQAMAVLGLACLEYVGVRKAAVATA